jgi:hypothetical protein
MAEQILLERAKIRPAKLREHRHERCTQPGQISRPWSVAVRGRLVRGL